MNFDEHRGYNLRWNGVTRSWGSPGEFRMNDFMTSRQPSAAERWERWLSIYCIFQVGRGMVSSFPILLRESGSISSGSLRDPTWPRDGWLRSSKNRLGFKNRSLGGHIWRKRLNLVSNPWTLFICVFMFFMCVWLFHLEIGNWLVAWNIFYFPIYWE